MIALYDLNVILFKMINFYENYEQSQDLEKELKLHIMYLLNRGPDTLEYTPHKKVFLDDSKPYWRNKYCPDYKGNRPPKPAVRPLIRNLALRYIHHTKSTLFTREGFEADDFAGAFTRIYHMANLTRSFKLPPLLLWTVDSDWLQLVNDDLNISWHNTGPWEPRIRREKEAVQWSHRRISKLVRQPQDIVALKCIQGDKSDNLPPNTPPFLIDLINTPQQHRLTAIPEVAQKILDTINNPVPDSCQESMHFAAKALTQQGLNLL